MVPVAVAVPVGVRVGVCEADKVPVGVRVNVAVAVGVCVREGVTLAVGVRVAVEVGVLVTVAPEVVNVFVTLVAVAIPSLATAYHSYCVPVASPGQVIVAFEPEGTVVVPICVNGAELPCIS
jgi:hypothetical protein